MEKIRNILEELYLGNIAPYKDIRPDNPKYYELLETAERLEAEFLSKLDYEGQEKYKKIKASLEEATELENMQSFVNGCRLTVDFTVAALKTTTAPKQ